MSRSEQTSGTAGAYFPWLTMGLGSKRNMRREFSDSLSACTAAISTQVVVLDWRFANVSWSSTAAVSGWSNLRLAEDPPSASPSPRALDSDSQANSETSADLGLRTVLLVDDNPTDVFVIREAIERSGLDLNLHLASNGEEALLYLQDLAESEKPLCPALVLLDLNLPKVGGIEVLRHLRGSSLYGRTPVIVITSSTAEADRAAVRRLGAEAYFQKPTSLSAYMELAEVVKRILRPAEEGGGS